MKILNQWFALDPFWLIVVASVVGICTGIFLRKVIRREKLLVLFILLALYLGTEYMVLNAETNGLLWTILGGKAAMLVLGIISPSITVPWNMKFRSDATYSKK